MKAMALSKHISILIILAVVFSLLSIQLLTNRAPVSAGTFSATADCSSFNVTTVGETDTITVTLNGSVMSTSWAEDFKWFFGSDFRSGDTWTVTTGSGHFASGTITGCSERYGCTDAYSSNYDFRATVDDRSCDLASAQYHPAGPGYYDRYPYTSGESIYDLQPQQSAPVQQQPVEVAPGFCSDTDGRGNAETSSDGVVACIADVNGCTNVAATNYNAQANQDDGSCTLPQSEPQAAPASTQPVSQPEVSQASEVIENLNIVNIVQDEDQSSLVKAGAVTAAVLNPLPAGILFVADLIFN